MIKDLASSKTTHYGFNDKDLTGNEEWILSGEFSNKDIDLYERIREICFRDNCHIIDFFKGLADNRNKLNTFCKEHNFNGYSILKLVYNQNFPVDENVRKQVGKINKSINNNLTEYDFNSLCSQTILDLIEFDPDKYKLEVEKQRSHFKSRGSAFNAEETSLRLKNESIRDTLIDYLATLRTKYHECKTASNAVQYSTWIIAYNVLRMIEWEVKPGDIIKCLPLGVNYEISRIRPDGRFSVTGEAKSISPDSIIKVTKHKKNEVATGSENSEKEKDTNEKKLGRSEILSNLKTKGINTYEDFLILQFGNMTKYTAFTTKKDAYNYVYDLCGKLPEISYLYSQKKIKNDKNLILMLLPLLFGNKFNDPRSVQLSIFSKYINLIKENNINSIRKSEKLTKEFKTLYYTLTDKILPFSIMFYGGISKITNSELKEMADFIEDKLHSNSRYIISLD